MEEIIIQEQDHCFSEIFWVGFISIYLLFRTVCKAIRVAEREEELRTDCSGLYGTTDLEPYKRKALIKETFFSLLLFAFTYCCVYPYVGNKLLNVGFFMICAINFYVALKPSGLRGAGLLVFLHIIFAIVAYIKILNLTYAESTEITCMLALEPLAFLYLMHLLNDD